MKSCEIIRVQTTCVAVWVKGLAILWNNLVCKNRNISLQLDTFFKYLLFLFIVGRHYRT